MELKEKARMSRVTRRSRDFYLGNPFRKKYVTICRSIGQPISPPPKMSIVKLEEEEADSKNLLCQASSLKIVSSKMKRVKAPSIPKKTPSATIYCEECDKDIGENYFETHLETNSHKRRAGRNKIIFTSSSTSIFSPNGYCCFDCKSIFSKKRSYIIHLQVGHRIKHNFRGGSRAWGEPKKRHANTYVSFDPDDPSFHCTACKWTYGTKYEYHGHLKLIHKMDIKLPSPSSSNTIHKNNTTGLHDINDPNFFCRSCNSNLKNVYKYRQHLYKDHQVDYQTFMETRNFSSNLKIYGVGSANMKPDIDDPNFYCCACKNIYASSDYFRFHIRKYHA